MKFQSLARLASLAEQRRTLRTIRRLERLSVLGDGGDQSVDRPVSYRVGLGVTTGGGVKDDSVSLKALGTGIIFGRRIGVSFLDNEVNLDLFKAFKDPSPRNRWQKPHLSRKWKHASERSWPSPRIRLRHLQVRRDGLQLGAGNGPKVWHGISH